MNVLNTERRAAVVRCLIEGCSIRSTVRITGVAKNTILKLLLELGEVCADFQDRHIRNVATQRVECDEIWSFVGAKEKTLRASERGQGRGDCWTWTAIDSDSKLILGWQVGYRDTDTAVDFMRDVASRLANRVQLTTDGFKSYLVAVPDAFGREVDFAMLAKKYGPDPFGEKRYSPAVCLGIEKNRISGDPNHELVSTSYVERQNLTMRMGIRRMTRLTNAFSKKWENHAAAISLHFMYYNFCRVHETLGTTPAVAAGIATEPMEIVDIIALLN